MALINHEISDDYFQLIQSNIASILLTEFQNQYSISGNKDLDLSEIWKDRRTSFNMSDLPAVNLSIGRIDYSDKHRLQKNSNPVYHIDIYSIKNHTSSEYADTASSESAWKMAQVIQYILDYPEYATLGKKPYVKHVEVTGIESGESEIDGGGRCMILRLSFLVNTITNFAPVEDPVEIQGNDTTVKLSETEKGYYYQLD